jgi:hypothetical protein
MERKRLLLFAILQVVPILLFPPAMFLSSSSGITGAIALAAVVVLIFALLGWGLLRGRGWALTMSIFLQGLNLIVRLMMLFPNAVSKAGVWDVPLIITYLAAILLSGWLMVRLDRPDVRSVIIS